MSLKFEIIVVTGFQQNCSLIWCTETMEAAVVDPGGDVERILQAIERNGVKVEQILLTHGHLDHAGGAASLARQLHKRVIGPQKEDDFWLQGMEMQGKQYGFVGAENCTPDQWLNDGDSVQVGNQQLDVYHCPGHTPGHVIFYNKDSKMAFVGDVLFSGSIGRTDFPRGNHADLLNAIVTKLWPLGNDTRFVSGHGEISDFGRERASNPFVSDAALA